MRILVLLTFLLASCANSSPEVMQKTEVPQPKAALRAHVVPGMTFGNVALQKETMDAAARVIAAQAEHLDCARQQIYVTDTWPFSNPTQSEFSDAFLGWTELWTFEVCGNDVDIAVVYMLHKESGIIDVKVSRVEEGDFLELS